MPSYDEIRRMVSRVEQRIGYDYLNAHKSNQEYRRKREQHLLEVIRQVVLDFYHRHIEGFEEIVREIRRHFP